MNKDNEITSEGLDFAMKLIEFADSLVFHGDLLLNASELGSDFLLTKCIGSLETGFAFIMCLSYFDYVLRDLLLLSSN